MEINKIYQGDCLEVMKTFPDECIDLTVTSPPYDDLRNYKGYFFDFKGIAEELYRVTKKGGVIVWIVGDATVKGNETGTSFKQALFFKELGFNLYDTMIYEKAQTCFGSNKSYLQSFEYMFVLTKGLPKTIRLICDRKNIRSGMELMSVKGLSRDGIKSPRIRKSLKSFGRRKNIWKYGVGGGKINHPAVFPEKLAADHIVSWSNTGDIVLDPMIGSGTTAKMSKLLGRNYVGIEISPEYCKIAEERINAISNTLF